MFIVLEGIDGSGKTTQIERLAPWMRDRVGGRGVVSTFEPGGWDGGDELRRLAIDARFDGSLSRFFVFMADRCEHAARVIAPALREGRAVLCDRYIPSTIAYQIYGAQGISEEVVRRVAALPHEIGLPQPDAVVWLDISAEEAARRAIARGHRNALDSLGQDHFERIIEGYRAQSSGTSRSKWFRVDASRAPDEVFDDIVSALAPIIGGR